MDAWLLNLLAVRTFRAADFHETREGACRILAPFTHELAETLPLWGRAVAAHAEDVAHHLAATTSGKIVTSTPLTNRRRRAAVRRTQAATPVRSQAPGRSCTECGEPIEPRAKMCGPCWTLVRPERVRDGYATAHAALAEARLAGVDPTQSDQARQRRNITVLRTTAADAAWDAAHPDSHRDLTWFKTDVVPALSDVRLSSLMAATGLSQASCSLIRGGKSVPHPRHWAALARLADAPAIV